METCFKLKVILNNLWVSPKRPQRWVAGGAKEAIEEKAQKGGNRVSYWKDVAQKNSFYIIFYPFLKPSY